MQHASTAFSFRTSECSESYLGRGTIVQKDASLCPRKHEIEHCLLFFFRTNGYFQGEHKLWHVAAVSAATVTAQPMMLESVTGCVLGYDTVI